MLRRWEELPEFMRTDAVRPYYKALEKKRYSLYLKRLFDFSMSSVMLILLSPVLLGLGIWIRMDSEGPVFYRQKRITQYGRPFEIYKFRTMVVNADRIGSQVTVGKDPRITRGRFLSQGMPPGRTSAADQYLEGRNDFCGDPAGGAKIC